MRLSRREDGTARGSFTTTSGRFMPARGDARTYPALQQPQRATTTGTRPTPLTASEIRAHYPLRLLLAFHLPDTQLVYHVDDSEGTSIQLQRGDGSWARVPLASEHTGQVTYGGDDGLWKQAETALQWWNLAGRPEQDAFGYVREADGSAAARYVVDGTRWSLTG